MKMKLGKTAVIKTLLLSALVMQTACSQGTNGVADQAPPVNQNANQNKQAEEQDALPKPSDAQDALPFVGQDADVAAKTLGEPASYSGSESADIYEYEGLGLYVDPSSNLITDVEVTAAQYHVQGITVGAMPEEMRTALGKALDEGNTNGTWGMKYVIEDYQIIFISNDFQSPISKITVGLANRTPAGQRTVTIEEAKELFKGTWINEEIADKDRPQDLARRYNGEVVTDVSGFVQPYKYQVESEEVILFESFNSITKDHFWDTMHYTFSEDGNSFELFRVDEHKEKIQQSVKVYLKYSNEIE